MARGYRRRSTNVPLPDTASAAARFNAMKLFPSPPTALATTNTLALCAATAHDLTLKASNWNSSAARADHLLSGRHQRRRGISLGKLCGSARKRLQTHLCAVVACRFAIGRRMRPFADCSVSVCAQSCSLHLPAMRGEPPTNFS